MPEWGSRLHRKEKKDRNNGKEQTEEHEGLGILKTVIIDRKNPDPVTAVIMFASTSGTETTSAVTAAAAQDEDQPDNVAAVSS